MFTALSSVRLCRAESVGGQAVELTQSESTAQAVHLKTSSDIGPSMTDPGELARQL